MCRVLMHLFGVVQAHRTSSNLPEPHQFCDMSSGWFDCTEPSLSTSLQGKQGVETRCVLVGHFKERYVCC